MLTCCFRAAVASPNPRFSIQVLTFIQDYFLSVFEIYPETSSILCLITHKDIAFICKAHNIKGKEVNNTKPWF